MEPADWFDDGERMGLRKDHMRKILKRVLRRWMGKSVRSQEWKIVEKVMKLKMTGTDLKLAITAKIGWRTKGGLRGGHVA